ncbi:MAG: IclR family transcriptional regulator [Hyphomicrobiales bacterium]|nr:MAG: IclR family transcriptional regulator [Hyphomicrobiales bacterium]
MTSPSDNKSSDSGGGAGPVKSADRLMQLLEYLSESGASSFASIMRALGLPGSSAHQLLQTAVSRRFIDHAEGSKLYRLGPRLWEVAQGYKPELGLVELAQPLMDGLTESTRETVQLAQLDGLYNVYLAIAESPQPMKLVSRVGSGLPAHATGVGKVLLAFLEPAELDRRLAGATLERFTASTITDKSVLRSELDMIRARGYAQDIEEYVIGCRCIAMPIRAPGGQVEAAMSISIPTPRYNPDLAARIHVELRQAIEQLESQRSRAE